MSGLLGFSRNGVFVLLQMFHEREKRKEWQSKYESLVCGAGDVHALVRAHTIEQIQLPSFTLCHPQKRRYNEARERERMRKQKEKKRMERERAELRWMEQERARQERHEREREVKRRGAGRRGLDSDDESSSRSSSSYSEDDSRD